MTTQNDLTRQHTDPDLARLLELETKADKGELTITSEQAELFEMRAERRIATVLNDRTYLVYERESRDGQHLWPMRVAKNPFHDFAETNWYDFIPHIDDALTEGTERWALGMVATAREYGYPVTEQDVLAWLGANIPQILDRVDSE